MTERKIFVLPHQTCLWAKMANYEKNEKAKMDLKIFWVKEWKRLFFWTLKTPFVGVVCCKRCLNLVHHNQDKLARIHDTPICIKKKTKHRKMEFLKTVNSCSFSSSSFMFISGSFKNASHLNEAERWKDAFSSLRGH